MAITNNGTKVKLNESLIPADFVKPNITEFVHETAKKLTLNVPKATVENADPAMTLQNILDNATVGVNKQITDDVSADFDAINTVEIYSDLISITNNVQANLDSDFYKNVPVNYVCEVLVKIRTV